MASILIIDDEAKVVTDLAPRVSKMGHRTSCANSIEDGLRSMTRNPCDAVFLAVGPGDASGLDAIQLFQAGPAAPEVIVMASETDPDAAEQAIRAGAWGYVRKTDSMDELLLPLERALEYRGERPKKRSLKTVRVGDIVGASPAIRACLDGVGQAAACRANVLITGETGTGKELFARAIHASCSPSKTNFVVVDCTILPDNLVESILFGHRKGAFTGAERDQDGLIACADGGVLFLDEVGDLPFEIQKKFLRVLESGTYRPLGDKMERISRFRVVAATNRNLGKMVEKGTFRKDLLFRLSGLRIELPPLRERPEDIADLVDFHGARLCELYEIPPKNISSNFLEVLEQYGWPGNARELVNAMDVAIGLAGDGPTLHAKHIPVQIRARVARIPFEGKPARNEGQDDLAGGMGGPLLRYKEFKYRNERNYLERLLLKVDQDVTAACRISGISRTRIYELLKKHRISFSAFSSAT